MRIYFEGPSGRSVPLSAAPESSIRETRRRIAEQLGANPEAVLLFHAGQNLLDDKVLKAYNVAANSTLTVRVLTSDEHNVGVMDAFGILFQGAGCGVHEAEAAENIGMADTYTYNDDTDIQFTDEIDDSRYLPEPTLSSDPTCGLELGSCSTQRIRTVRRMHITGESADRPVGFGTRGYFSTHAWRGATPGL